MKNLAILSACLLLTACGATGTAFSGFQAPEPTQAKLYVYRPAQYVGGALHYDVHAGEQVIGHLRNGGYIVANLPAGEHTIWAKTEVRREIKVPLKAGETACVRASMSLGAALSRINFDAVSPEVCEQEIKNTKISVL